MDAKPLPASFNVREFEAMAQALVADQRVPGLAMAIVHNGRVLSARGYGITDVRLRRRLYEMAKAMRG